MTFLSYGVNCYWILLIMQGKWGRLSGPLAPLFPTHLTACIPQDVYCYGSLFVISLLPLLITI